MSSRVGIYSCATGAVDDDARPMPDSQCLLKRRNSGGVPFAKFDISKSTNNASATSNPFYFFDSQ
jgi:hypothetical protein